MKFMALNLILLSTAADVTHNLNGTSINVLVQSGKVQVTKGSTTVTSMDIQIPVSSSTTYARGTSLTYMPLRTVNCAVKSSLYKLTCLVPMLLHKLNHVV